jgi:hypothetical protein
MTARFVVFALSIACATTSQSGPSRQQFELEVPARVGEAQTYLVLKDVEAPRNASIVLRAYALLPDTGRMLLGSTAIPGVAPDARGVTTVRELRINVTSALRRYVGLTTSRKVRVDVVSVADSSAVTPQWRARAAEFVQP